MSTQLAEADVVHANRIQDRDKVPVAWFADESIDDDRRLSAARGIAFAVLLATPFWLLVGFVIYLLR